MIDDDRRLVLVENLIEELQEEIADLEWVEPDHKRLPILKEKLKELIEEKKRGVRYHPMF